MLNLENIVFFGSNNLAKKCLINLHKNFPKSKIYVVAKKNYNKDNPNVFKYASKNKLHIITLGQICRSKKEFSVGFSIRYHKILNKKIIDKFKYGIVNLHGGPLPHYRGNANHVFAILNNEKKFGVTLHYINEGIDSGNIISKKMFKINKRDTGYTLFNKVNIYGYELVNRFIKNLKKNKLSKGFPQNLSLGKNYKINDLKKMQNVNSKEILNKKLIYKKLRAFYHPYKNSIFLKIKNKKNHLKLPKNQYGL